MSICPLPPVHPCLMSISIGELDGFIHSHPCDVVIVVGDFNIDLSVIGGDFVLESVVRCTAFVRYSEFGGCTLFGSKKCTASTGMAVGTSMVVRYSEEVRYWEGPLSEVPL